LEGTTGSLERHAALALVFAASNEVPCGCMERAKRRVGGLQSEVCFLGQERRLEIGRAREAPVAGRPLQLAGLGLDQSTSRDAPLPKRRSGEADELLAQNSVHLGDVDQTHTQAR